MDKTDLDINVAPKVAADAPPLPPCMVRSTPILDVLDENTNYGDFRDGTCRNSVVLYAFSADPDLPLPIDLMRDGYCVVKEAIPRERSIGYAEDIHEWLESFGLGYKRDDPSTIREECLPVISPKGMVQAYGGTCRLR